MKTRGSNWVKLLAKLYDFSQNQEYGGEHYDAYAVVHKE